MKPLSDLITINAPGDHACIRRHFTSVESGVTITQAWMTVKRFIDDEDVDAIFQKVITTADVLGTGQIEAIGSSGTLTLRFDILPADSLLIGTDQKYFDIQVKTNGAKIYTINSGTIRAVTSQTTITS